jgi:cytohesin
VLEGESGNLYFLVLEFTDTSRTSSLVPRLPEFREKLLATDAGGNTALHVAAENGHIQVVEMLLTAGVDVAAADRWGRTALFRSVDRGHENMVRMLVEAHANVEAADFKGDTPLHRAASKGYVQIVEILLVAHADVHAKDSAGFTPRNFAVNRHGKVAEMLLAAENG